MKKFISTNLPVIQYVPEHSGAHYTMNGEKFFNNGDRHEISLKHAMGFKAEKDGNTAFDVGSDIEELEMSVKSSKATLTNEILGYDMDTSLETYFARTASTCWAWAVIMDETITAYIMNAEEFKEFTKEWASFNKEGRIRYKSTSGIMIKWLEERV